MSTIVLQAVLPRFMTEARSVFSSSLTNLTPAKVKMAKSLAKISVRSTLTSIALFAVLLLIVPVAKLIR